MMKVSVIVPVYGVESYVEACLRSVAAQTVDCELECIIVDDKGPDNSMSVVRNFVDNYSGRVDFRIVEHDRNRGLSAARNTGMRHSCGEYVYFLDSDDEMTPDAIAVLLKAITQIDADFVIADYEVVGHDHGLPRNILPGGTVLKGKEVLDAYCMYLWYMMTWNKLIKRSFLENNGISFFEGIIHEDNLWSFECALHASKIGIIDNVCYRYFLRENSITTSTPVSRHKIESRATIFDEVCRLASDKKKLTPMLHFYIRHLMICFFTDFGGEFTEGQWRHYYYGFRRVMPESVFDLKRLNLGILSLIKYDLHLAMPRPFNLRYFKKHYLAFPWCEWEKVRVECIEHVNE